MLNWIIRNKTIFDINSVHYPAGWDFKIHRFHLCSGVTQRVSWYDTKQSDGEVSVMLELWEMRSTPSLSLLPLWHGMVAPDKALYMG